MISRKRKALPCVGGLTGNNIHHVCQSFDRALHTPAVIGFSVQQLQDKLTIWKDFRGKVSMIVNANPTNEQKESPHWVVLRYFPQSNEIYIYNSWKNKGKISKMIALLQKNKYKVQILTLKYLTNDKTETGYYAIWIYLQFANLQFTSPNEEMPSRFKNICQCMITTNRMYPNIAFQILGSMITPTIETQYFLFSYYQKMTIIDNQLTQRSFSLVEYWEPKKNNHLTISYIVKNLNKFKFTKFQDINEEIYKIVNIFPMVLCSMVTDYLIPEGFRSYIIYRKTLNHFIEKEVPDITTNDLHRSFLFIVSTNLILSVKMGRYRDNGDWKVQMSCNGFFETSEIVLMQIFTGLLEKKQLSMSYSYLYRDITNLLENITTLILVDTEGLDGSYFCLENLRNLRLESC